MATESTITIRRGEHATLDFTMDPVVDISGWSLAFTIARHKDSETKLYSGTPTVTSGPSGTFRMAIDNDDANIAPGTYYWDAWRIDSGYEEVLAYGTCIVAGIARLPSGTTATPPWMANTYWTRTSTTMSPTTAGDTVSLSGPLLFTDATYDIGASGATRPRDLHLSRNAVVGGVVQSAVGSAAAPAFAFTAQPTFGVWRQSSTHLGVGGIAVARVSQVYLLGDSISSADTWEDTLTVLLGATAWDTVSAGTGGDTTTLMAARVATDCLSGEGTEYLVVLGGINDIIADVSAATIEANLQSIYDLAAAAGVKVVAATITPWKAHASWTAGRQAVTDAVNAWIVAQPTNVDYVADTYTALEDPGTPDTLLAAYDSGDGLHPSSTGYTKIGQTVYAAGTWTQNRTVIPTLGVTGACYVDQDLRTDATPSFYSFQLSGQLILPADTESSAVGVVKFGTLPYMHAYGANGRADLNFFIGDSPGNFTLTGVRNTGGGYNALVALTSGSYNTAWGGGAGSGLTTGQHNTFVGYQAGKATVGESYQVAVGSNALLNATGGQNTAQGLGAGRSITTGTYNVFMGYECGYHASQLVSATNSFAVGQGAYTTASNTGVLGNASVTTVLIGGPAAAGRLHAATATLNNLATYADNAAALAGGLTAGQLYKTSTGVVMITY